MAETAVVGVPESIARALVGPNLVSVTIGVAELLDESLEERRS